MTLKGSMKEIGGGEKTPPSIIAVENKIWHGAQRTPVVRSPIPVQASLGARGKIERGSTRAVQCPGFVYERSDLFRANAVKPFFLEHCAHQTLPCRPIAFQRVDQGQRDLAFLQIAQHRLA